MLPKTPPRRRIQGLTPGRRSPSTSTRERVRGMVREHEEEERPFDPEKRGSWRGSGRELVVNPNQFQKDLEELIVTRWGRTLDDPEQALSEAKRILAKGGRPADVMRELDELLDTHGVEYIPGMKEEIAYLNAGDTYEPTIMYSHDENKYFVSDWGTLVEEASSQAEEDAWDDWLEAEVRSELEAEFEARFEDDERSIDRAVTALEGIDSAALKGKFWHALGDVGGEYTHESDGSVFVSRKDKAVQELAHVIIKMMEAVPEQTSFGFNPRRRNSGTMGREDFIMRVRSELGNKHVTFSGGTLGSYGALYVNFINLPSDIVGRRGGAEAENNRMMFKVDGWGGSEPNLPPPSGKVRVEQMVSVFPREYRLRAKSGEPSSIARYLADFINRVAVEVPPNYTHSRAPNAPSRVPRVEVFTGKTIDARVTMGGIEYERTLDGQWETYGGGADGSPVRDLEFHAELDELVDRSRAANPAKERFEYGKHGLKEDPVGHHVAFEYRGSRLLGTVRAVKRDPVTGALRLVVRHFNGEPWPVSPVANLVEVVRPPG